MKKYILSIAIFFTLLLGSSIFLPYLFKDKIVETIYSESDSRLNVKLDFDSKISINIFKSFPNLSLGFSDVLLTNLHTSNQNDTFLYAERIEISLDLMKFYKEQTYIVKTLNATRPLLFLKSKNDSIKNWNIVNESLDVNNQSNLQFELSEISVKDGGFVFSNILTSIQSSFEGINLMCSGEFNPENYFMTVNSSIENIWLKKNSFKIIDKWEIEQSGNLTIFPNRNTVSLHENSLSINGLSLDLEGNIKHQSNELACNLSANSKNAPINSILTLIPSLYSSNYTVSKSEGTGNVKLNLNGVLGAHKTPNYSIGLDINNGQFAHSESSVFLEELYAKISISNTGGKNKEMAIDMPILHFKIGNNPFSTHLSLANIFSNTSLKVGATGLLNFAHLKELLRLENTELAGELITDVEIEGQTTKTQESSKTNWISSGEFYLKSLILDNDIIDEKLNVDDAYLKFANNSIDIQALECSYGENQITTSGRLSNILGHIFKGENVSGELDVYTKNLNLDEVNVHFFGAPKETSSIIRIPKNVNLSLAFEADNLSINNMNFTNSKGKCKISNRSCYLSNVSSKFLEGNILLNGKYRYQKTPLISLTTQYSDLNIRSVNNSFDFIHQLAPIARQFNGKASGELLFSSMLSQDFSPRLETTVLTHTTYLQSLKCDSLPFVDMTNKRLGNTVLNTSELHDIQLTSRYKNNKLSINTLRWFTSNSSLQVIGSTKDGNYSFISEYLLPGYLLPRKVDEINYIVRDSTAKFGIDSNKFYVFSDSIFGNVNTLKQQLTLTRALSSRQSRETPKVFRTKRREEISKVNKESDKIRRKLNNYASSNSKSLKNRLNSNLTKTSTSYRKEVGKVKSEILEKVDQQLKDYLGILSDDTE